MAWYYPLLKLYWRIRKPLTLGVRLIVTDDEKGVLLVRHTYVGGWYLPGGGVEKGETFLEAARRELWEECGVEAREMRLCHLPEQLSPATRRRLEEFRAGRFAAAGGALVARARYPGRRSVPVTL